MNHNSAAAREGESLPADGRNMQSEQNDQMKKLNKIDGANEQDLKYLDQQR